MWDWCGRLGNGVKDREGESGDDVCWIDGGNGGRQLEREQDEHGNTYDL